MITRLFILLVNIWKFKFYFILLVTIRVTWDKLKTPFLNTLCIVLVRNRHYILDLTTPYWLNDFQNFRSQCYIIGTNSEFF